MKTKYELFLFITLTLIASVNLELGGQCEDKKILEGTNFLYDTYEDHKSAYNEASSCISLHTEDDDSFCCYLKIKFRNRAADKKFTHKGCTKMFGSNAASISDYINGFENSIEQANENIDKVDIDIDCNSKFIKITGLVFLALLL